MAAYHYEYRVKGLYSVQAQVVGEFCEQLEASEGGLTPKTFVDASRNPESPTHSMLEWDMMLPLKHTGKNRQRALSETFGLSGKRLVRKIIRNVAL